MARPRPHDDTLRNQLIELASEAVADGGVQALSLRRLASAAGTTTAAVYSLFGGRHHLVSAVVDEGFRRFTARLDAVARTADPGADLLALGVAYRENAVANPHFYQVMFGGAHRTDEATGESGIPAVARPTFTVLRDAVARLPQSAGGDPEAEALRLWALVHGLVSLELAGLLPGTPDQRGAQYVEALLAGSR